MSWKHIVPKHKKKFVDDLTGETGTIVGHYGVAVDVRLANGDVKTLRVKRRSGHVVGDEVTIAPNGLIGHERSTEIKRVDVSGKERVVVANLDMLGMVIAPQPETTLGFIDRVIVGTLAADVEPFIVVNKSDTEGAQELYDMIDKLYGWRLNTFFVCAETGENVEQLEEFFGEGYRGAFIGTSGVGKSSLLNDLCPHIELETCEINEDTGFGRHATTAATLNILPSGGELIDTPGFRDFRVMNVSSTDLAWFFVDFQPIFQKRECKFHDCSHTNEPGCVILEAIENGEVKAERHAVYLKILEDVKSVEEGRVRESRKKRRKGK